MRPSSKAGPAMAGPIGLVPPALALTSPNLVTRPFTLLLLGFPSFVGDFEDTGFDDGIDD